jgi:hypothetical protein
MGRNNADFFHGTNKEFSEGDLVLPASVTGASRPTEAEYGEGLPPFNEHEGVAFASKYAPAATYYARRAAEKLGGTPNVYKVTPIDENDLKDTFDGMEIQSKAGFKVVGKVPLEEWKKPRKSSK